MLGYQTEQTCITPTGAQLKGHFVTHAGSKKAALISAHVAFVSMVRNLR